MFKRLLAYDETDETVRIPNEEVKTQFVDAVRHSDHLETARLIQRSDRLLQSTIEMDAEAVAKGIDAVHNSYIAPLFYNNEQALRSVVKIAYISSINQYVRIEEMPSGKGYADLVYIPRRGSVYPALLIELKADGTSAEGAIEQIHKKNYPSVLENFGGPVLLVGISYDSRKRHRCVIESMTL